MSEQEPRPAVVEWGRGRAEDARAPVDEGPPDPARIRQRPSPYALGCALTGLGLVLVAQALPWMVAPRDMVEPGDRGGARPDAPARVEVYLEELATPLGWVYNLGWLVVLALVAAVLAERAAPGRRLAGAALGACAGQLAALVGLAGTIVRGGGYQRFTSATADRPDIDWGIGVFAAFAALALLAAAVPLAARPPGHSPDRPRDRPDALAEPVDLAVTPLRKGEGYPAEPGPSAR